MRLPYPTTLKNRGKSRAKDARILNGMVDKRRAIVKRPSLNASFEAVEEGPGLGLFVLTTPNHADDEVIAISNDVLTFGPTVTPFRLRFSVQPSESNINTAGSPTVTVQVLDRFGDVVTTSSATITLTLSTNPTSATLGGTTSKNATNGVATFTDLTMSRSGEAFRITASGPTGTRSATSNTFDVPTVFAFTTQPSNVQPDEAFVVVIAAQDTAGNTDTNYFGDITVAIYSATGNGLIGGFTTRLATSGIATFSGLSIDEEGTYTLIATGTADPIPTAYKPANRVSNSFNVDTFTHTLTAGNLDFLYGYEPDLSVGSISPSTVFGATIASLTTNLGTVPSRTTFSITGTHAKDFFTSLTGNGITVLSSAADYSQQAGESQWVWESVEMFPSTGTYNLDIV